ncbi:hypothetical protein MKEN_01474100 [Mycena kentingensis (nom. inval.)]|nr:hypothetical protein MKEN_01474100 [Mycena kentingensis (nom. inval.)]
MRSRTPYGVPYYSPSGCSTAASPGVPQIAATELTKRLHHTTLLHDLGWTQAEEKLEHPAHAIPRRDRGYDGAQYGDAVDYGPENVLRDGDVAVFHRETVKETEVFIRGASLQRSGRRRWCTSLRPNRRT